MVDVLYFEPDGSAVLGSSLHHTIDVPKTPKQIKARKQIFAIDRKLSDFAELIFAIEHVLVNFEELNFAIRGSNRENKFRENFCRKNFCPRKFLPLRWNEAKISASAWC